MIDTTMIDTTIKFPALCVDDFYQNPDEIRKFALSQNFESDPEGRWPGKRTKELHELDMNLFHGFCKRLFSIYFDLNSPITWHVATQFQLIEPMSDDPNSKKNSGWIHCDGTTVFSGIIYLTPNIDKTLGTSIYKLKDGCEVDQESHINAKVKFYRDNIDEDYDNVISKHNNMFEETVTFSNVYNRLISFDGNTPHGVKSYYGKGDARLTQTFFVEKVSASIDMPLHRWYI
jgi:hypothetical protein